MNKLAKNSERIITGVTAGSIVAVFSIILMTVFAEVNPAFKKWLAVNFTHHWIGKSVLSIAVFLVTTIIFTMFNKLFKNKLVLLLWVLIIIASIGVMLLLAFFYWHSFP
ncbi:hypothetical protein A2696_04145 [Candidatus Curtissbacteria bacterium RIFCSPHIGHO2_01_FULL_41_13]|uniref:DUF5658 domain-containing protein n=1 Tax=Candidatus Curtissbacteria bacterium RIFCSPHIGHO2_01_FULL_41_13 TaxID=1797745 RepID=A0A1F5FZ66_9BACT|nr:MAG: hypothetical protein A2696_04145 [Candidatus Curtissbacteria bacterium RIFCSPHIGHO2_01_FULL_41_13]